VSVLSESLYQAVPLTIILIQFAYHETSFFLVKLLQQFSTFSLALDVQPVLPPASWVEAGGIQAKEKVMPASTLTLFVRVSDFT